jgi:tRNA(fMet)-specific endonuclease VapC
MEYILDTNTCIYIIKQKPENVFKRFNELPLGSVCISTITLAELQFGVAKSSNPDKNQLALNHFLVPLEVVDFDATATIEYGKIRAQLESKGYPIGSLDTLIAAHAKSLNLTLVTNNTREFSRVENLRIENWL